MYEDDKDILVESNELAIQDNSHNLYKVGNDLTSQIISETDPNKLEDLTILFKANQKKKDIARINKLSNLLDLVDDEVITRFTSEPETFDHSEVIKLMTTTQKSMSDLSNSLEQVPVIQINNQKNEININNQASGLDLASRKRVLDAVRSIIDSSTAEVIDVEIEE